MLTYLHRLILPLLLCLFVAGARADSAGEIEAGGREALARLLEHAPEAGELLERAEGVLVFPDVVKMGFGVGGEYGEGVLLVKDQPAAYFATAGASFGLQLGAQYKTEIILFMTRQALVDFRNSRGWEVGVNASVTLVELGAAGRIDTAAIKQPVVGFIFSNNGLMYDLSFDGSKISRIAR